jgi:ADP-heptose:LPS heptosyltransferase
MHQVKEWPAERWARLAADLSRRGLRILISGSASDRDKSEELAELSRHHGATIATISGQFRLQELAQVLSMAEVVVSVNTGVAHLAGIVGARTVSLEGPTPPIRWRPLGPRVAVVETTFPGCGYLNLGFEYAGRRLDCMEGISVDAVLTAIDTLPR